MNRLLRRYDLARAHRAHQVGYLRPLDRHQLGLYPAHLLLQCVAPVSTPIHADPYPLQSPKHSTPHSKTSTPSSRHPPHGSWAPAPAGVWPRSWPRARRRRPCTWRWRRAVAKTRRTFRQSRRGPERNDVKSRPFLPPRCSTVGGSMQTQVMRTQDASHCTFAPATWNEERFGISRVYVAVS
jgi:hypothetical protein